MGSKLGVQRRKEKGKRTSSVPHHTTNPQHPQFPIDTEQHQYHQQQQQVHHPRNPAGTTTTATAAAHHNRRSTSTARGRGSETTAYSSSGTTNAMDNSQQQHRQPHQQNAPPARRELVRKLSSARSFRSFGSLESPTTNLHSTSAPAAAVSEAAAKEQAERQRRIVEAEKILEEIAKEYAAKRAAGLVPTVPVPARTLLWEELARNERNRVGKRGQCVFGRDTDNICGCQSYTRKKFKGQDNPGGICDCCGHGGPWHRLAGGSMTQRTSRGDTRSYAGSSVRGSRLGSVSRSDVPSMRSMGSEYDDEYYDDDYDDEDYDDEDDEDDDEDISLEVARPYGHDENAYHHHHHQQQQQQYPVPTAHVHASNPTDSDYDFTNSVDRSSMFSSNSSLGLPPRLSSGTNQLEALLKAIKHYRQLGLSEDEIEVRIREDFPPVDRTTTITNNNDSSSRGSRRHHDPSYASGELASM